MSKIENMDAAWAETRKHALSLDIPAVQERDLQDLRNAIREKMRRGQERRPRVFYAIVGLEAIDGFTPILDSEGKVIRKRSWRGRGGWLTVATRYRRDGKLDDETAHGTWEVGWSWQNPGDTYSVKRGRAEARGRLTADLCAACNHQPEGNPKRLHFARLIAARILDGTISVPTWALAEPHQQHRGLMGVVESVLLQMSEFSHG